MQKNVAFFLKSHFHPFLPFWEKNAAFFAYFAFFYALLKRTQCSLHSFTFFWKERNVLCVILRSFEKNTTFFAFFWKERKWTQRSFGLHKLPKTQKKNAKERCVLNAKERGAQPWKHFDLSSVLLLLFLLAMLKSAHSLKIW